MERAKRVTKMSKKKIEKEFDDEMGDVRVDEEIWIDDAEVESEPEVEEETSEEEFDWRKLEPGQKIKMTMTLEVVSAKGDLLAAKTPYHVKVFYPAHEELDIVLLEDRPRMFQNY